MTLSGGLNYSKLFHSPQKKSEAVIWMLSIGGVDVPVTRVWPKQ